MSAFAQITQGPATATGANTNKGALIFDRQNNITESVGDSGVAAAHQTSLLVQAATAALVTITTAQNLLNFALNAAVLNKVGRTILISGVLIYTTPGTTTPALTIALKLGGTTICSITTAALSATASTNMPVQYQFELNVVSTGASGTVECHGSVNANISANTPAAASTCFLDTNTAVSSAINLLSQLNLTITVAANSAISSIQSRQLTVEVVN